MLILHIHILPTFAGSQLCIATVGQVSNYMEY